MNIAVVGAGISGLVAAHMLRRADHDVTIFEAACYPGGHTNTISVETEHDRYEVDTGFIVFNDRNYPAFEELLRQLDVPSKPSQMSFGVADGEGDFEYASTSANGLFATRRHMAQPSFYRMMGDVIRFQREAKALLRSDEDPTLRAWLVDCGFGEEFIERLIVPQAAAVWSADPDQLWTFPARFLVEFFDNHGMLGFRDRPKWRVVRGGSARYVDALIAPFGERLRLSTPIASIERFEGCVEITPVGGEPEAFDEVVIGTHSDQALAMLADPSDAEHEILGAIPYQPNEAVLHTDRRLLPKRRRAWASWNYHLLDPHPGQPTVTYHMNRLQGLDADREFCVTLNHSEAIDPSAIIRTIAYAHPVYTREGAAAQRRHDEISGRNRTHYCGAYWGWGFHEDGVKSGKRVAERIGAARVPVLV